MGERMRVEPTAEELAAVEAAARRRLAVQVTAMQRRARWARSLPMESAAQFASRVLRRPVAFLDDLPMSDLQKLKREILKGGKHAGGDEI
jgi:hypothetical protein